GGRAAAGARAAGAGLTGLPFFRQGCRASWPLGAACRGRGLPSPFVSPLFLPSMAALAWT
ncbi:hypothetical protein, partial [Paracidovorax avenae]|uniref:hypothetical protein n=1 Tax=Paracidovorax avenae TaxID=80867 RepID=UPI001F24B97D